jgi:hypothetical protein
VITSLDKIHAILIDIALLDAHRTASPSKSARTPQEVLHWFRHGGFGRAAQPTRRGTVGYPPSKQFAARDPTQRQEGFRPEMQHIGALSSMGGSPAADFTLPDCTNQPSLRDGRESDTLGEEPHDSCRVHDTIERYPQFTSLFGTPSRPPCRGRPDRFRPW